VRGIHADAPCEEGGVERTGVTQGVPSSAGFRTILMGCGWPGRACPWVEQPSKASGSAQASSRGAS
jgi:hypothetical protein